MNLLSSLIAAAILMSGVQMHQTGQASCIIIGMREHQSLKTTGKKQAIKEQELQQRVALNSTSSSKKHWNWGLENIAILLWTPQSAEIKQLWRWESDKHVV